MFKEHTIPLEPDLDTPEMTEFARYIKKLHKDRVIPRAGDYNVAKALLKKERLLIILMDLGPLWSAIMLIWTGV